MTAAAGARRGAATVALVTAFVVSGALAWRAARAGRVDLLTRVADALHDPRGSDLVPLGSLLALVAAAALVGAAMGAIAARIRGEVADRVVLLSILCIPALWALLAAALVLRRVPSLLGGPLALLPLRTIEVLGEMVVYASGAMALALPIGGGPAVVAALLVEGWTRPRELPSSGAARPAVRGAAVAALSVATAALSAYAALRGR